MPTDGPDPSDDAPEDPATKQDEFTELDHLFCGLCDLKAALNDHVRRCEQGCKLIAPLLSACDHGRELAEIVRRLSAFLGDDEEDDDLEGE